MCVWGGVNYSHFEEAVQALVPSSKLHVFDSRLDRCEWNFSFLDSHDNTLYSLPEQQGQMTVDLNF